MRSGSGQQADTKYIIAPPFFPGLLKGQPPHSGHRWPCLRPGRPPLAPRCSQGSQRARKHFPPSSCPHPASQRTRTSVLFPIQLLVLNSNTVSSLRAGACLPFSLRCPQHLEHGPTQSFSHYLLVHSLTQQIFIKSC